MKEENYVQYWNEDEYFDDFNEKIKYCYDIATKAKNKGLDFANSIEVPLAKTVAERCVNLIKTLYPILPINEISDEIRELEKKYGKQSPSVAFFIAREVADEKFCKFESKKDSIDAGLRVGFAYLTLGVVASPIEGYTGLEIKEEEGKKYFNVKFSGPIRSAGTTATCVFLMLIDSLREYFGYDKYVATEDEINRYFVECMDYNKISNLQYLPTEDEIKFLIKNIPIQIDGDPTELSEVSNYKDLKRVEENRIRGGMCLVLAEGLAQKALKALQRLKGVKENGIQSTGFDYLNEYSIIHSKRISGENGDAIYIKDLVAGRPVYGYPSKSGGFRFRYGKCRDSGFSAVCVSPATMGISEGFLSFGTQIKIEKPIKGAIITSCDTIDGPIVKLKNGSVRKIKTFEEGKKITSEIKEIIYWGDILISLGDVVDRNSNLLKSGYVEEWWDLQLKEKMDVLDDYIKYDKNNVPFDLVIRISKKYSVPLHPSFIYYWSEITVEQFIELLKWIKDGNESDEKYILPFGNFSKEKYSIAKRCLELIGLSHEVVLDNVVIEKNEYDALFANIGILQNKSNIEQIILFCEKKTDVLSIVDNFSEYKICDKSGDFIGARMGRPEKAKLRKSSVNTLSKYSYKEIITNTKELEKIKKFIGDCALDEKILESLKGNKGAIDSETNEDLRKGILRSYYRLNVNKDGTIRYDGTEIPLTHFKPKEIDTSVEKLKEIGYNIDIYGNELQDENQILELKPHDIVLPGYSIQGELPSKKIFYNICNFLDDELNKIYSLEKMYNLVDENDLVGKLVVCIAPHNCAGVVGRIVGFSQMQGILASPYMHAAIRRDCDGDEMSVIMLMDVLLNFSREFLPKHRGGTQDAPLILNGRIYEGEVDDQILEYDIAKNYDIDLYEKSQNREHSSKIINRNVKSRLKVGRSGFCNIGFTHDTFDINDGEKDSSYKELASMKEKVDKQMDLVDKIRAVDKDNVAKMIIEKHFLKDIKGNLSNFFKQQFRCSSCGTKCRRIPLTGVCPRCGGNLLMTTHYASIKKYIDMTVDLIEKYNIPEYTVECVNLVKKYIEDIFGEDKQVELDQKEPELIKEKMEVQIEEIKPLKIEKKETIIPIVEEQVDISKIDKDKVDFVHLHLHTEYSFLDGTTHVNQLFKRVKELGMDSVAITEHGNMEYMVNKYKEAKKAGVKLIFGIETYVVKDINVKDKNEHRGHLILLAKDNIGLKNLMKLSSIASCNGFYYRPRIDKKILKENSEGIICCSACIANDIANAIINDKIDEARKCLDEYLDIFGKDFYLEVQNHNIPEEKKVRDVYYKWAEELGINLIATCDSHYLLKEDARAHEAMLCIQTNGFLNEDHFHFNGDGYYVMSKDEMIERFPNRLDALNNTKKISDMCNVDIELGKTTFPEYTTPDGFTHDEYITKLCVAALEEKYSKAPNYDDAKKRMEYELSVIKKMGFSTYFLIVRDFINAAKTKCQVGPGRGSGAGSIVAYLLGITQLEPLHLNLLFERFLNPDRISLPDFDVDFGNRDIVIDYVKEKYGNDKVALIGNYGTMSAKSVLKDVMRVFKIPFNISNNLTKVIPNKLPNGGKVSLKGILEDKDSSGKYIYPEIHDFKEKNPEIFDIALKLENGVRQKGVHACGVVWGKEEITNYLPVMERDGYVVVQAEFHEVEDIGLVKFDFLGLETLNITKKILNFIGKDDSWLEQIPLDDAAVYEMLQNGNSSGVFQLESEGMKKTLISVKPTCFDDIIAIVALYRPGPMQYLDVYARRKKGLEQVSYPHKLAEEILAPTYGIMVYQEQVMQLAQKLAGFSMAEADTLRKAIGKKKLDLMKSMEEKFKDGCLSVAKMTQEEVDKLWNDIVMFASYSFNKSHAAAYALISYRTAYLRKYYPVEFMAATISSNVKDPSDMSKYLYEAKKMGISILGPDINTSLKDFNVEQKDDAKIIRFGLNGIKNIGSTALDNILSNRPYNSYKDFISKIDGSKVNKRVLKNLICVGCFDGFGINRGVLMSDSNLDDKPKQQMTLFESNPEPKVVQKMTLKEMINYEKDLMEVCISASPVDFFVESKIARFNNFEFRDGEEVSVFGIVGQYKKILTKKGDNMAVFHLDNRDKNISCVLFPNTFEEINSMFNLKDGDGIIVNGVFKDKKRDSDGKERDESILVNEISLARIVSEDKIQ